MPTLQINSDAEFQQKVLTAPKITAVFTAPWCPYCRIQEPHLKTYFEAHPQETLALVNLDNTEASAAQFKIDTIPSAIVFKAGKAVNTKMIAYLTEPALNLWLDENLKA